MSPCMRRLAGGGFHAEKVMCASGADDEDADEDGEACEYASPPPHGAHSSAAVAARIEASTAAAGSTAAAAGAAGALDASPPLPPLPPLPPFFLPDLPF